MEIRTDPARFSSLVSDVLQSAIPGETLVSVLQASSDPEFPSHFLGPLIARNQAYAQLLLRMDLLRNRLSEWVAEDETLKQKPEVLLERSLALLGKTATRNVIACIGLSRIRDGLPRKKSDAFRVTPKETLKHALLAEEFCLENSLAHAHMGYEGGLHYDWLLALLTRNKAPKDVTGSIARAWTEGFETAKIAYDIGRNLKAFRYDRFVFAAGLVLPVGKVLMGLLHPKPSDPAAEPEKAVASWAAFVAEADKRKTHRSLYFESEEERRFPIVSADLSALYCSYFGILAPVEKAIAFHRRADQLKGIDPDLFVLAAILGIASRLQANPAQGKAGMTTKSLPITPAQRTWLEEIGIKDTDLLALYLEISGKGGGR